MKKKYDLVFGLGPACSCSQTLRRAGVQLLSFPFDWVVPGFGTPAWDNDLRRRTDIMVARFSNWLREEDFKYRGDHTNGKARYFNTQLGMMFLHDFPQNVPLSESFPAVAAKYERREKRLLDLIGRSRNVLVVRLDRPDLDYRTPDEDGRYVRETLSRAFAPAKFDYLAIQQDASVPFDSQRLETVEPGFFRLKFDYLDHRPGAEQMFPRLGYTSAAVAEHFAVREYRTKAEIAAHREREKRKRWEKYGAANAWQYRWRRLLARFRHDCRPEGKRMEVSQNETRI